MPPRTDFTLQRCPVARSMAVLGERWAILILREAFYGVTRFDEFERTLGIAPNILAARLRGLVEHGVLRKVAVEGGRPGGRYEYRLTDKGRDIYPAFLALKQWGDRWMAPPDGAPDGTPGGPVVEVVERSTGRAVEVAMVPAGTVPPMTVRDVVALPGPGATPALRARLDAMQKDRADAG